MNYSKILFGVFILFVTWYSSVSDYLFNEAMWADSEGFGYNMFSLGLILSGLYLITQGFKKNVSD
jgi:hypothetical protein